MSEDYVGTTWELWKVEWLWLWLWKCRLCDWSVSGCIRCSSAFSFNSIDLSSRLSNHKTNNVDLHTELKHASTSSIPQHSTSACKVDVVAAAV